MSRQPSKDVNEDTNPGNDPLAGSPVAADLEEQQGEDEFPAEATRIDQRYMQGEHPSQQGAQKARTQGGTLESLAAARTQAKKGEPPPRATPAKVADTKSAKLAALQSLSLGAPQSTSSARRAEPRQTGGSSRLPWVVVVLLLIGIGGYLWRQSSHNGGERGGNGELAVRTEHVAVTGGSGSVVVAAGFTNARSIVSIGTPSGGAIKEVKIQNGDKIKKGQIIINFDDSAAKSDLASASLEVAAAARGAKLQEDLYKAQGATRVDVEKARTLVTIARTKLFGPEQRIKESHLHAPNDATVLDVLVHPGEAVAANAPLVKVADLHELVAEVDINEADIKKIRVGQAVDVTADAVADAQYKGKVREIAQQADKAKGTVTVKVDLELAEQTALRPQMSVKCTFQPVAGEQPRMYIPRSALSNTGAVWVVGGDRRVSARPVQAGTAQGPSVEVLGGLRAGEEIVSEASSVHDGQMLPLPQ